MGQAHIALSHSQISAIRHNIRRGREIIERFPQVAEFYRTISLTEIVESFNLDEELNCTKNQAIRSLGLAIAGFEGGFREETYTGLINNQTLLESLRKERRARVVKKGYERGIRLMNESERYASVRRGVFARGAVPWKERECYDTYCRLSEKEFAYRLHLAGYNKNEITDILNRDYHEGKSVRIAKYVKTTLSKYRKALASRN